MHSSLRTLLTELIDYAGLFPPAKLPLEAALAHYRRYTQQPEAWMLGRFLCPTVRLGELAGLVPIGEVLRISALGRGGTTSTECLTHLEADLTDIAAVRSSGRLLVDVLEVRWPADALRDGSACNALLAGIATRCRGSGLALYFEAPLGDRQGIVRLLAQLSEAALDIPAGFKMRCGGLEAAAFPSTDDLTFTLAACAARKVPLKATAGLHHPLPRFDSGVQARMHGFINLLTASVFATPALTPAILDDDDPAHFTFAPQALRWREWEAAQEEIVAGRLRFRSFGSCSFDEPRDDLRALGWL